MRLTLIAKYCGAAPLALCAGVSTALAQAYRPFIKEVMESQTYPVRHYTPDGEIATFPRGGSDITGAILAVVGFSVFVAADDLTVVSTMLRPIIVDLGITFGNEVFPEHDVMMADTRFIEERRE